MISLNPKTEKSKYVWMDGQYQIFFTVRNCAEQYRIYYSGIVIPIMGGN